MPIATYEDVKNRDDNTLLIDVREKNELAETGVIPKSINIPCELETALKSLSAEEFKAKYGHVKPNLDQPLIFSCKLGGRAQKAVDIASAIGYKNLYCYKGSWAEWAEKSKK